MKHFISTSDLDRKTVEQLLKLAVRYYDTAKDKEFLDEMDGKMLAALFYEPSTRTRLSTETAMHRLGGTVINAVGEENSSLRKGETLQDTAKVMSHYADVIAIRHKKEGSAREFAEGSSVPVINCGDGPGDHPTQAMLDALTIYRKFGRLDNLTVALIGDLKNSRTQHALLTLLRNFKGCKARLASPDSLKLQDEYKFEGIEYAECKDMKECVDGADIIYSSRIQVERFDDMDEYNRLKDYFVFTRKFLDDHCEGKILMAPLPRIDEILPECDDWEGSVYFSELANGVAVRMAIISKLCT